MKAYLDKRTAIVFSVFIITIIILIVLLTYISTGSKSVYKEITIDSDLDIDVSVVKVLRGDVYLNNQYAISTAYRIDCSTNKLIDLPGIKDLSPPYRLVKPKGRLLYIIRHDTLCFKLPQDNKIQDLTFRDLFDMAKNK